MNLRDKFNQLIGKPIKTPLPQLEPTNDEQSEPLPESSETDAEAVDEPETEQPSPIDVAHAILEQAQVQAKWEEFDGKSQGAEFAYQGGHFILRVWQAHPHAQITMPAIHVTDVRNVDIVRNVVNRVNMESIFARIITTTNDSTGEIVCHAAVFMPMDEISSRRLKHFHDALTACFIARRDLSNYFDEQQSSAVSDMQVDLANSRRDIYLMGEQAWMHDGKHVRVNNQSLDFTIAGMLRCIFDWNDVVSVRMQCLMGGKLNVMDNAGDFQPLNVLVSDDGVVLAREAVLVLSVQRKPYQPFDDEVLLVPQRAVTTVTAMMRVVHADDVSAYIRITLAREGVAPGNMPAAQHPDLQGDAVTFTVACDFKGLSRRQREFDCIMKDATDKVTNEKENELTDIQDMLLANDADYNQGYHIYWGASYVRHERYCEALAHFLSAYNGMLPKLPQMKKRARTAFYEIMYYIGLCYARLGQTDRAFYYLDAAAQNTNNNTCLIELINCLVNATDPRAENLINSVSANVRERMNDEDDEDNDIDSMQAFLNFLYMRRAYLYVSQERWDEAESLLNQLMTVDDARQFAMNELAYIATHRNK